MAQAQIIIGEQDAVFAHALKLAKGLNCLSPVKKTDEVRLSYRHPAEKLRSSFLALKEPCGICISCRVFDSKNHPDTLYVVGEKSTSIGVDDVRRQIILPMSSKPFSYKYKVFIIDKAETLTPSAQNALLKTIEEPAPYGFFLFLATHEFNFLQTLLSRCVLTKLQTTSNPPPEAAILAIANEICNSVGNGDTYDAFLLYKKFEPYKDQKDTINEILNVLYKLLGDRISQSMAQGIQPSQTWFNAVQAIPHTKKIISQNGNIQLALELMLRNCQGIN